MEKQIVTVWFSGYMNIDINKLEVTPKHASRGTPSTAEEKLELLLNPFLITHELSFEQARSVCDSLTIEEWEVITDD